jgi:hypothetical protein
MKEKNKKIETMEASVSEAEIEMKAELENDVLVVQEASHLKDGIHNGKINNIVHENRQGYDYIDMYIDVNDEKGSVMTIKTGFPAYISTNSGLGRFLIESGMSYKAGDKIGLQIIREELIGKKIVFQTYTEDNFAKVLNKTIKFN